MIIEDEKFKELATAYTRALEKLGSVAALVGFEADAELPEVIKQVTARMNQLRAAAAPAAPKTVTIPPEEEAAINATLQAARVKHEADGTST